MNTKQTDALKLALDALRVARESVSEWSSYASDYFKDKYDLDGDFEVIDVSIEVIEAVLADHIEQHLKMVPQTPEQIKAFIGSDFVSREHKVSDVEPHEDDQYCVTAHNLISAFAWWAEQPEPTPSPDEGFEGSVRFYLKKTNGQWERLETIEQSNAFFRQRLAEQPAQQPNEADELIRNLGFDPEQFRTEAGFINHMKLRAAIKHPDEYQAAMQPMYQKLTNCILCGRLNPKEGVCDHGVEQPAQGDNK